MVRPGAGGCTTLHHDGADATSDCPDPVSVALYWIYIQHPDDAVSCSKPLPGSTRCRRRLSPGWRRRSLNGVPSSPTGMGREPTRRLGRRAPASAPPSWPSSPPEMCLPRTIRLRAPEVPPVVPAVAVPSRADRSGAVPAASAIQTSMGACTPMLWIARAESRHTTASGACRVTSIVDWCGLGDPSAPVYRPWPKLRTYHVRPCARLCAQGHPERTARVRPRRVAWRQGAAACRHGFE